MNQTTVGASTPSHHWSHLQGVLVWCAATGVLRDFTADTDRYRGVRFASEVNSAKASSTPQSSREVGLSRITKEADDVNEIGLSGSVGSNENRESAERDGDILQAPEGVGADLVEFGQALSPTELEAK